MARAFGAPGYWQQGMAQARQARFLRLNSWSITCAQSAAPHDVHACARTANRQQDARPTKGFVEHSTAHCSCLTAAFGKWAAAIELVAFCASAA